MIELVEKVTEKKIPYKIVSRRPGDIDTSIANVQKAKQVLGREYSRSMYQAIEDAWRFTQKGNSNS
jgi:UDP-glucose 4-epimerase